MSFMDCVTISSSSDDDLCKPTQTSESPAGTPCWSYGILNQKTVGLTKQKGKFACQKKNATQQSLTTNKMIQSQLRELETFYFSVGDQWRSFGYRKAANAIGNLSVDLNSDNYFYVLSQTRGIGSKIIDKVGEMFGNNKTNFSHIASITQQTKNNYVNMDVHSTEIDLLEPSAPYPDGQLQACSHLEFVRKDTTHKEIKDLSSIWGIGPTKARKLHVLGITSFEKLRYAISNKELKLSKSQNIGLQHAEDLKLKMERWEVERFCYWVRRIVATESPFKDHVIAVHFCGSFRRGKKACGDVDILLIKRDFDDCSSLLEHLTKRFFDLGLLTDSLSSSYQNLNLRSSSILATMHPNSEHLDLKDTEGENYFLHEKSVSELNTPNTKDTENISSKLFMKCERAQELYERGESLRRDQQCVSENLGDENSQCGLNLENKLYLNFLIQSAAISAPSLPGDSIRSIKTGHNVDNSSNDEPRLREEFTPKEDNMSDISWKQKNSLMLKNNYCLTGNNVEKKQISQTTTTTFKSEEAINLFNGPKRRKYNVNNTPENKKKKNTEDKVNDQISDPFDFVGQILFNSPSQGQQPITQKSSSSSEVTINRISEDIISLPQSSLSHPQSAFCSSSRNECDSFTEDVSHPEPFGSSFSFFGVAATPPPFAREGAKFGNTAKLGGVNEEGGKLTESELQEWAQAKETWKVRRNREMIPRVHRRLDLKLYPESTEAFALLYFTGSAHFNRSMRLYARNLNLSLNDYGLFPTHRVNKKRVWMGQGLTAKTEEDIFNLINLDYVSPIERDI